MADVMDLLRLEGPAAETSEASQLQPSLDQLMILIHRLEDQVIIGETYLAFSLEVAHNRVQRLRGDATARCLSLMDSSLPLVKPLSARNLIGEPSSSADLTIAVTTALSTTFVQTDSVPTVLSSEVPPPPKIVFEEEELNTTPKHVPAPSELAPVFRVACFVVPVDKVSRAEICASDPGVIVFFHLGFASCFLDCCLLSSFFQKVQIDSQAFIVLDHIDFRSS
ncbi:hypothetical protein Tco_0996933 [Tanacetum coccineum]